ncbi:MAG: hypothetical protein JW797_05935 [Bradymonadales bacterium]|nr:hypothetical protein [Bradymonadales bacterium]
MAIRSTSGSAGAIVNRQRFHRSFGLPHIGLWMALTCLAVACGYRPVATVAEGHGRSIHVPAFLSHAGYPELDLFAASHLGTRLAALGFSPNSWEEVGRPTVQGVLLSVSERTTAAGEEQILLSVSVSLQLTLIRQEERCTTPVAEGEALLPISREVALETDRLGMLETAVADAIDSRLIDLLWCLEERP